MIFANQKIEENVAFVSNRLDKGGDMDFVTSTANYGFTEEENHALEKLKNDLNLKKALT